MGRSPPDASHNWWEGIYNKFIKGDNAAIVNTNEKLPWIRFGTKHVTSHDIKVKLGLDFSFTTSATLITLGAMGVYAARLKTGASRRAASAVAPRGTHPQAGPRRTLRAPKASSGSWLPVNRAGTMSAASAAAPLAASSEAAPPAGSARSNRWLWFGAASSAAGLLLLMLRPLGTRPTNNRRRMLMVEEDSSEDESRIEGSRRASVAVPLAEIRKKMAGEDQLIIGVVELGGVRWRVVATYRNGGDLLGLYLMHRDGSKDQIAFSIKVVDASGAEEHVLAEERFGGNWVFAQGGSVLPGLASDGQGTCIDVVELHMVSKLRVEFQAHGPATKHEDAM